MDDARRVAVVTGAARGIGRASAVALAEAGHDVAGIDIAAVASATMDFAPATEADLAETGRLVEAAGGAWLPIVLDQRDIGAVRDGFAAVVDRFGGVDVVFANAGIQGFSPILEMTDADWHDQIDVNLSGTANVVRVAAPLLVERGGGRIIVTSSTQGQHGTLDGSAYSASKWGLIGLVKSAALELGPHGITVNAVVPGLIDTVLTRHEDRYAQAIATGGGEPRATSRRTSAPPPTPWRASCPCASRGSSHTTSHPSSCSSPPTPRAWSAARPTPSPAATAPTSRPDG